MADDKNKYGYERADETGSTRLLGAKDIVDVLSGEIGPSFREYRELFEKASHFEFEAPYPIHVDFETAAICNLKCPMCSHGEVDQSDLRDTFLDFELFKKVIDEGVGYTLRSVGLDQEGEPLLNKNLVKFIKYAREKGIQDVMINTNALALTKERTEELLGSGLTRIHFSLDAIHKETYDKIRVGSDYDKVYANVLHFLNRKKELNQVLPLTRVSFIKMSTNEAELDEFRRYWEEKVDMIAVQEYNSPNPKSDAAAGFFSKEKHRRKEFRCTQPWFRAVVFSNGDVAFCCLIGYSQRLKFGNVRDTSLHELWNSSRGKELRKIHFEGRYAENPVCLECVANFAE